jgi:transposase
MRLVYLPAYSPDFNPIEEGFSAMKAWIPRGDQRQMPRHSLRREGGLKSRYFTFWTKVPNASKNTF